MHIDAAKRCFLCGAPGPDTTEHVVPRCIYGSALPSDVVTLPAHRACNAKTMKAEENFRNFIAAGIGPENPGHRLWETAWRSFQRPEARGLKLAYFSGILSRDVMQPDGSTSREPVAVTIKDSQVDWVLAKIVKGLFTRETKQILPNRELRWKFGHLRPHGDHGVRLPYEFELHNVLRVRWGQAEEDPLVTLWVLAFYEEHLFHVSTSPSRRVLHNRASKMKPMAWP